MNRFHEDEHWMREALHQALKGAGSTSPNPMVGACVVSRGALVSSEYHRVYGGPHAEVLAIKKAGNKARRATLYVTLEPCSTWGKTGPCVEIIIQAGIKRVVIGALDPNPAHAGRGIKLLKKAGIVVRSNVLKEEAEELIAPFRKWITTGYPYVTLKMAQTLDGKIATASGESRWITSPESRRAVHRLRGECDAVLVGGHTVLKDDPSLDIRVPGGKSKKEKGHWKIILDREGKVPLTAKVFSSPGRAIRVVSSKRLKNLRKLPAGRHKSIREVIISVSEQRSKLNLRALMPCLGDIGITRLLVEGGGETAWSFLSEGLVDHVFWMVAPKILGGRDAITSVEGRGVTRLSQAIPVRKIRTEMIGNDMLIEGWL